MFFAGIINIILSLFLWTSNLPTLVNSDAVVIALKPDASRPELSADKGAVLAANDHFFLFTSRADEAQPIASITKLMTALVFLDHNPGWQTSYKIVDADHVAGGRLNLFRGDEVIIKDLFYTSLIASDNGATLALVHSTGLSEGNFVKKMNEKARQLGLAQTSFQDPIGLSDNNVSTAREVALLAQAALKRPEIRDATARREYNFKTSGGRDKKIESTDYLLYDSSQDSLTVLGGKTGYTDKAGYCFVGLLQDERGREVISVVLNSSGKNDRFRESRNLANWVFKSYNWGK